jgi:hypothetical protein
LRDELAERDVAQPPAWAWAWDIFGERLAEPRAAEQRNRGVRAVARYRLDYGVADQGAGHGP